MNYELEDIDYYSNQTTQISLPPKVNPIFMAHAKRMYESSRIARDDFLNQLKLPIPPLEPLPTSYEELKRRAQRFQDEMFELDELLNKQQVEQQQFQGDSFGQKSSQDPFDPKGLSTQLDPKLPDDSISQIGESELDNDCC